jgi:uncharacterized protein (DUF2267 family)
MRYQPFLDEICVRTGLTDRNYAAGAAHAVLDAVGAMIDPSQRERIAAQLPSVLAQIVRDAEPDHSYDDAAFLRRVSASERLPAEFELEHTAAVLEVLAAELDPASRRWLGARMPETIRDWLRPRPRSAPPPPIWSAPQHAQLAKASPSAIQRAPRR